MIEAEKELIRAKLKQNTLLVRDKELSYFTRNFENLGTQAALLGGFAFSGLTNQYNTTAGCSPWISVWFHVFASAAMICNLLCVCSFTCITMFGPGLALRGGDGSMQKAVKIMQEERAALYRIFGELGRIAIVLDQLHRLFIMYCVCPKVMALFLFIWQ